MRGTWYSSAIGREGQNVRLAHRLTNWKIDIKSESQAREIENRQMSEIQYEEADSQEDYIEEEEVIDEIAQEALEETSQFGVDEDDTIEETQEIEEETEEV